MHSTASIMWAILFSSIGLGYFIYGKKQLRMIVLLSGIGLMVFPYFVGNAYLLVFIGIALMVLPCFMRY